MKYRLFDKDLPEHSSELESDISQVDDCDMDLYADNPSSDFIKNISNLASRANRNSRNGGSRDHIYVPVVFHTDTTVSYNTTPGADEAELNRYLDIMNQQVSGAPGGITFYRPTGTFNGTKWVVDQNSSELIPIIRHDSDIFSAHGYNRLSVFGEHNIDHVLNNYGCGGCIGGNGIATFPWYNYNGQRSLGTVQNLSNIGNHDGYKSFWSTDSQVCVWEGPWDDMWETNMDMCWNANSSTCESLGCRKGWPYNYSTTIHEIGHCFSIFHIHQHAAIDEAYGENISLYDDTDCDIVGDMCCDTPNQVQGLVGAYNHGFHYTPSRGLEYVCVNYNCDQESGLYDPVDTLPGYYNFPEHNTEISEGEISIGNCYVDSNDNPWGSYESEHCIAPNVCNFSEISNPLLGNNFMSYQRPCRNRSCDECGPLPSFTNDDQQHGFTLDQFERFKLSHKVYDSGCMDPSAFNYDPSFLTEDNSRCRYGDEDDVGYTLNGSVGVFESCGPTNICSADSGFSWVCDRDNYFVDDRSYREDPYIVVWDRNLTSIIQYIRPGGDVSIDKPIWEGLYLELIDVTGQNTTLPHDEYGISYTIDVVRDSSKNITYRLHGVTEEVFSNPQLLEREWYAQISIRTALFNSNKKLGAFYIRGNDTNLYGHGTEDIHLGPYNGSLYDFIQVNGNEFTIDFDFDVDEECAWQDNTYDSYNFVADCSDGGPIITWGDKSFKLEPYNEWVSWKDPNYIWDYMWSGTGQAPIGFSSERVGNSIGLEHLHTYYVDFTFWVGNNSGLWDCNASGYVKNQYDEYFPIFTFRDPECEQNVLCPDGSYKCYLTECNTCEDLGQVTCWDGSCVADYGYDLNTGGLMISGTSNYDESNNWWGNCPPYIPPGESVGFLLTNGIPSVDDPVLGWPIDRNSWRSRNESNCKYCDTHEYWVKYMWTSIGIRQPSHWSNINEEYHSYYGTEYWKYTSAPYYDYQHHCAQAFGGGHGYFNTPWDGSKNYVPVFRGTPPNYSDFWGSDPVNDITHLSCNYDQLINLPDGIDGINQFGTSYGLKMCPGNPERFFLHPEWRIIECYFTGCDDGLFRCWDNTCVESESQCRQQIYGCTDIHACNFPIHGQDCCAPDFIEYDVSQGTDTCIIDNPQLPLCPNIDDGSCDYGFLCVGGLDDGVFRCDPGDCYETASGDIIEGCMDPGAENYNPDANTIGTSTCLYLYTTDIMYEARCGINCGDGYGVSGFQFNMVESDIINITGGVGDSHQFTISFSDNTIVGFSLTGNIIEPIDGERLFATIEYISESPKCIVNSVVADPDGVELDSYVYDCNNIRYGHQLGCTDPTATNYYIEATDDDGSCTYAEEPEEQTYVCGAERLHSCELGPWNVYNCVSSDGEIAGTIEITGDGTLTQQCQNSCGVNGDDCSGGAPSISYSDDEVCGSSNCITPDIGCEYFIEQCSFIHEELTTEEVGIISLKLANSDIEGIYDAVKECTDGCDDEGCYGDGQVHYDQDVCGGDNCITSQIACEFLFGYCIDYDCLAVRLESCDKDNWRGYHCIIADETQPDIPGCMDNRACNYNPNATESDGTCQFPFLDMENHVCGTNYFWDELLSLYCTCDGNCLDQYLDCNGDCGGTAVIDECGVCGGDGAPLGNCCDQDEAACSPDDCISQLDECGVCNGDGPTFECSSDGSIVCSQVECPVYGCMDEPACNYNKDATHSDGNCKYVGQGEAYTIECGCLSDLDGDLICDEWDYGYSGEKDSCVDITGCGCVGESNIQFLECWDGTMVCNSSECPDQASFGMSTEGCIDVLEDMGGSRSSGDGRYSDDYMSCHPNASVCLEISNIGSCNSVGVSGDWGSDCNVHRIKLINTESLSGFQITFSNNINYFTAHNIIGPFTVTSTNSPAPMILAFSLSGGTIPQGTYTNFLEIYSDTEDLCINVIMDNPVFSNTQGFQIGSSVSDRCDNGINHQCGCNDEEACNTEDWPCLDEESCDYPPECYDCSGRCDVGCVQDCSGLCYQCDNQNGCDNAPNTYDCNGVCYGPNVHNQSDPAHYIDDCGECISIGELGDNVDCNGVCGGTAELDDCGVCCNYSGAPVCNSDKDCADVCFGDADFDCNGICDGGSTYDECGVCGGYMEQPVTYESQGKCDEGYCCILCDNHPDNGWCGGLGQCGDGNVDDECGVCGGDGIPDGYCDCDGTLVEDCSGVCGGDNSGDNCGECNGDNTSCCGGLGIANTDCSGGGNCNCNCYDNYDSGMGIPDMPCGDRCEKTFDQCHECGGDNSLCADDCGVPNGGNMDMDVCGNCPSHPLYGVTDFSECPLLELDIDVMPDASYSTFHCRHKSDEFNMFPEGASMSPTGGSNDWPQICFYELDYHEPFIWESPSYPGVPVEYNVRGKCELTWTNSSAVSAYAARYLNDNCLTCRGCPEDYNCYWGLPPTGPMHHPGGLIDSECIENYTDCSGVMYGDDNSCGDCCGVLNGDGTTCDGDCGPCNQGIPSGYCNCDYKIEDCNGDCGGYFILDSLGECCHRSTAGVCPDFTGTYNPQFGANTVVYCNVSTWSDKEGFVDTYKQFGNVHQYNVMNDPVEIYEKCNMWYEVCHQECGAPTSNGDCSTAVNNCSSCDTPNCSDFYNGNNGISTCDGYCESIGMVSGNYCAPAFIKHSPVTNSVLGHGPGWRYYGGAHNYLSSDPAGHENIDYRYSVEWWNSRAPYVIDDVGTSCSINWKDCVGWNDEILPPDHNDGYYNNWYDDYNMNWTPGHYNWISDGDEDWGFWWEQYCYGPYGCGVRCCCKPDTSFRKTNKKFSSIRKKRIK